MEKILGIDEVGRGPIAGPVVVAGIQFVNPSEELLSQITDSKLLKPGIRSKLAVEIKSCSKYYIAFRTNEFIDDFGISKAIEQCIAEIINNDCFSADKIIFDGKWNPFKDCTNFYTLVKGDLHVKEIGAASIIAKDYRDNWMIELDKLYPQYGFASHKGYGTKRHLEAIKQHGYCYLHRRSFNIHLEN